MPVEQWPDPWVFLAQFVLAVETRDVGYGYGCWTRQTLNWADVF